MSRNRKLLGVGGLILALIVFVAVNIISNATIGTARVDLTEDRLYTLSSGSESVLADLNEPLIFRFFYSEDLSADYPSIRTYATRVREMLQEFAAASNGKITLRIIHPEPFSDEEDEAVSFGVQGVPVNAAGDQLYFGLVATNSTDDVQTIPFFQQDREAFLEYDLTRLVYNLANPEKRVVGVMSELPILGGVSDPMAGMEGIQTRWTIMDQVAQFYDIEKVSTTTDHIPDDVDILMLVHPKDLSAKTRYAIDQYVLGGGRAIVFVDPHSEVEAANPDPENPLATHGSKIDALFASWGIAMEPGMVLGDLETARKVQTGSPQRPETIDYVIWLALGPDNLNRNDAVTGELNRVSVASAGILSQAEGATTTFEPLIVSSPQSMAIERFLVQFQRNPKPLLDEFVPSGERKTIAARITGSVKTAFPDGPPPEEKKDAGAEGDAEAAPEAETPVAPAAAEGGGAPAQQLMESVEPVNLIVVSDSDMLTDKFWVQVQNFFGERVAVPNADNAAFLNNALDNLSGSNELVSLRSRGTSQRPFGVVQALQREAEARFRSKEQELQQALEQTQQKIAALQGQQTGEGTAILTDEQRQTIDEFRDQMVDIRKELRGVQGALREDIDRLGEILKIINIGLVPLLVAIAAIVIAVLRRNQRRRGMRIG